LLVLWWDDNGHDYIIQSPFTTASFYAEVFLEPGTNVTDVNLLCRPVGGGGGIDSGGTGDHFLVSAAEISDFSPIFYYAPLLAFVAAALIELVSFFWKGGDAT